MFKILLVKKRPQFSKIFKAVEYSLALHSYVDIITAALTPVNQNF